MANNNKALSAANKAKKIHGALPYSPICKNKVLEMPINSKNPVRRSIL